MCRSPWIAAMLACLAGAAQAEDLDFSMKTKAAIASIPAARTSAPFLAAHEGVAHDAPPVRESIPFHVEHAVEEGRVPRSACERSAHDVCYDAAEGRIVYRAARGYMPKIGELTPESVSLRRNRIVFKYSF
ncbi:MAG TPA: hypothetical protein VN782_03975 [Usitatibacter sp.]|nr:hypothetical protein [Usitatibacter sp.]